MTIPSKDYVQLETYNQQLSHISKNIDALSQQLDYLHIAESMIEELSIATPSQELLIPIGSGLFLPVSAKELTTIKTLVGSGIVVDKTPLEAKEFIHNKKKHLESVHTKLLNEYDIISQLAIKLQEEMDKKV